MRANRSASGNISNRNRLSLWSVYYILRSGRRLSALKRIMEGHGAQVLALAVIVYQPIPHTHDFGSLPLYYLARLEANYYADASSCDMCKASRPVEKVWV